METMLSVGYADYEAGIKKHRLQFSNYIADFLSNTNPRNAMLFWIYFSANGVGMTEPVGEWLQGASTSCERHGYTALAKQLAKHIVHEDGHHVMMIEDLDNLLNKWNALYSPKLNAKILLNSPQTQQVIAYRVLHEDFINSDKPYRQIAIEFEVESLAISYGIDIVDHTVKIFGKEIMECLSFVDDHMKIDIAHTEFNRKAISNFLQEYPETVDHLIAAGARTLNVYGEFLKSCYTQALAL